MTLPNLITIGRLVLVPLVVVMIVQRQWATAFVLFVVAGLSDAVDGFIARRYDMRSEFGAYIDPLADKALLVSIYVTLAIRDVLPSWVAIAVVSRDAMIVAAILVSWLMQRPVDIKPLLISKLNTAAQIVFAAVVLGTSAFQGPTGWLEPWGAGIVLALTAGSAAAYLAGWLRHMAA
jgi:cardiolipin synthase (CMP-forming)